MFEYYYHTYCVFHVSLFVDTVTTEIRQDLKCKAFRHTDEPCNSVLFCLCNFTRSIRPITKAKRQSGYKGFFSFQLVILVRDQVCAIDT